MSLHISEIFYSVQAEGISTGIPAVFIRLKDCNLLCGHGDGATWICDTIPVWKKGVEMRNEELFHRIHHEVPIDWMHSGRVRFVFTGGEPLLLRNKKSIESFLDWLWKDEITPYVEIETNGTIDEFQFLKSHVDQVNCSPKLANSGMSRERRIVPDAILGIMQHPNYQFKFVISEERDIQEIKSDFIEAFDIPWDKVVLMPGVDKRENLGERTKFVYDMAKKYGYRAITRGHVLAWDQVTGV